VWAVQGGFFPPWLRPSLSVLQRAGRATTMGAAASAATGRPYSPPVRDSGLSKDRPGMPASTDHSGTPGDLGRPPQIVLESE